LLSLKFCTLFSNEYCPTKLSYFEPLDDSSLPVSRLRELKMYLQIAQQ
jgi:hypothetical protein